VLTDDRVVAIDTETDELVPVQTFGDQSNYLHGVSFNPSETRGLAASYWYDRGFITNFKVKSNGDLRKKGKLWLGKKKRHGAYSHNVEWLDDRYALAGSMQFGPTSLTPAGTKILGPGVWLLDAEKRTSVQIIGTAASADDPGVFRSASWLETVGDRLFIGEEDSLDATFGEDGYVSVFDISDRKHPVFLKRLEPGVELPADFAAAHGIVATPNGESVIVESYVSGYVVRIDVDTLEVSNVVSSPHMPHGGSITSVFH
jgi:hypothetical protein